MTEIFFFFFLPPESHSLSGVIHITGQPFPVKFTATETPLDFSIWYTKPLVERSYHSTLQGF